MYQPSDDGSFTGAKPVLVSGEWRTDLRFPVSEALTFYNVQKYVDENESLRNQLDEISKSPESPPAPVITALPSTPRSSTQRLFALTSWGDAGIPWITKCLNLHPSIRAFLNVRARIGAWSGANLGATQYVSAIADLSSNELCGDVNGISPHEFAELEASFGPAFRGAHLIGPPIVRYAGSLAYSRDAGRHWNHETFLDLWNIDREDPLSLTLLELLGEDGDHVPAHYMMHVNGIVHVLGTAPLFRIERLMAEDEEWSRLVSHISGGTIMDYGSSWRPLQGQLIGVAHEPFRMFLPPPARRFSWPRRAPAGNNLGVDASLAVWDTLPGTTRLVVAEMLSPQARTAYESLGYDPSFIR
jgi:hypothetical protein